GLIDEQGCAALSLEAVALAMKNLLRRALPENAGERRQVFKRLRQLRLIHYVQETDLDQSESWIKVRPLVVNLVTNEWLEKVRRDVGILVPQDLDVDEIGVVEQLKGERHSI